MTDYGRSISFEFASQRPQAPAQLCGAAEFINRLNYARKSLAVIVPTNDRGTNAARPLNVELGFFVRVYGVEEYQGRGRTVIGAIELALVHSHLLDLLVSTRQNSTWAVSA